MCYLSFGSVTLLIYLSTDISHDIEIPTSPVRDVGRHPGSHPIDQHFTTNPRPINFINLTICHAFYELKGSLRIETIVPPGTTISRGEGHPETEHTWVRFGSVRFSISFTGRMLQNSNLKGSSLITIFLAFLGYTYLTHSVYDVPVGGLNPIEPRGRYSRSGHYHPSTCGWMDGAVGTYH